MTKQRKLPPLVWLRAFREAAISGSFKGAAKKLNVSPSTISHEIRKLESLLETRLFSREPKGVVLTPIAKRWLSEIDAAFNQLESSIAIFDETDNNPIRIGALPFIADEFILPEIFKLESLLAGNSIQIVTDIHTKSLNAVDTGAPLDAVIRYQKKPDSGLLWIELSPVYVRPIAANSNLLASSLRRIQRESFSYLWAQFDKASSERIGSEQVPIVVDNYVSSMKAVKQGIGTALAVLPLSNGYIERKKLVFLSDTSVEVAERCWFVCLPSHSKIEQLKEIAEYLRLCLLRS